MKGAAVNKEEIQEKLKTTFYPNEFGLFNKPVTDEMHFLINIFKSTL